MYTHLMQTAQKRLTSQITSLQDKLRTYPQSKLTLCRNGPYYQWKVTENGKRLCIPSSNRDYAEQLAQKRLLEAQLRDYKSELDSVNRYLDKHVKMGSCFDKELAYLAPSSLIKPVSPPSEEVARWLSEDYIKSNSHLDSLRFRTSKGDFVRSKSEQLIAEALFSRNIAYRYECQLIAGKIAYYPDFTILSPLDHHTIIYWEHLGMMDRSNYQDHNYKKLNDFKSEGIILGVNLIVTYETELNPLDIGHINEMIGHFLKC